MAGIWTKEKIDDLLRLYEEEEVLWKLTHASYYKKDIRQAALYRLSKNLDMSSKSHFIFLSVFGYSTVKRTNSLRLPWYVLRRLQK